MSDFTISTRDSQYNEEDRLDVWTNFTIIKRFNKTGSWNLELPRQAFHSRLITPRSGIIVRRNSDNKIIFSGSVSTDFIKTKNTIKLSGKDDNYLLENPARPTPSQNFGPFDDEYFVNTGMASTIMIDLVNKNIGPGAPSSWKIPQLIMAADPLLGSTITVRGRFDPLITLLRGLASTPIATGLGFQILQSDTFPNTLEFSIYQPEDLSDEAIFKTELNNITDYEYIYRTPEANYFYVAGGDGFGTERTVVEGGDSASITAVGRIIAAFIDRRGTVDPGELNQALAEAIATSVTSEQVTVFPNDTPTLKYGVHYNLGDLVTVVVEGVEYQRLIREIEFNFTVRGGVEIKPLISDPNGSNDSFEAQHAASLSERLGNIERNWSVPDNSIIGPMLHDTMRTEIGDIKMTARAAAQPGWLLCNGSAISRSTYSSLFLQIGTLFGVGNGTTTFNLPDMRSRFPIGAGAAYTRGDFDADGTGIASHSHTHSHGGGNLVWTHTHAGQAHTHPGSHSHGMKNHTHDINHNHPDFDSGRESNFSADAIGRTAGSTTGTGHRHGIDIPALGSTDSGTPSDNSTNDDNNVHNASYSGSASGPSVGVSPWSGGTDTDDATGGDSAAVLPPYLAVNYTIYTGVV